MKPVFLKSHATWRFPPAGKNPGSAPMAQSLRLLVILVGIALIQGCAKKESPGLWTEEVQLHTGEVIQVRREFRWGSSGDLSVPSGPLTYASLDFEYRGKQYHWGERGLKPRLLQVTAGGKPVVVSYAPYQWAKELHQLCGYKVQVYDGDWQDAEFWGLGIPEEFNLAADKQRAARGIKIFEDEERRGAQKYSRNVTECDWMKRS